jgi:hypothetical protein
MAEHRGSAAWPSVYGAVLQANQLAIQVKGCVLLSLLAACVQASVAIHDSGSR